MVDEVFDNFSYHNFFDDAFALHQSGLCCSGGTFSCLFENNGEGCEVKELYKVPFSIFSEVNLMRGRLLIAGLILGILLWGFFSGFFVRTQEVYKGKIDENLSLSVSGYAGFQGESGHLLSFVNPNTGEEAKRFVINYHIILYPTSDVVKNSICSLFTVEVAPHVNGSYNLEAITREFSFSKLDYHAVANISIVDLAKETGIAEIDEEVLVGWTITWTLSITAETIYGTNITGGAVGTKGVLLKWVPPSVGSGVSEGTIDTTDPEKQEEYQKGYDAGEETAKNEYKSGREDGPYSSTIAKVRNDPTKSDYYKQGFEDGYNTAWDAIHRLQHQQNSGNLRLSLFEMSEGLTINVVAVFFFLVLMFGVLVFGRRYLK